MAADKEIIRAPFKSDCPGLNEAAYRFLQQVAQFINFNPPTWTEVTAFENSWVNYGSTNQTAGYVKDAFGFVHIKGCVKNGSGIPTVIFTLPAGYRPTSNESFVVETTGSALGACFVQTNGTVIASYGGGTSYFWLSGITFYAG